MSPNVLPLPAIRVDVVRRFPEGLFTSTPVSDGVLARLALPRDRIKSKRMFGIEAQTPDEFLTHLFYLNSTLMMEILSEQAHNLNNPPLTVSDVLEVLEIVAPGFVKLMPHPNDRN